MKLLEFTPWLVQKNKGPANVRGVVYFIGGGSPGTVLTSAWAAPYFFKTLSENGWDVIEAKQPQSQINSDKPSSVVQPAAVFLNRRVNELKAQGYKRVVAAGHSWGAWVCLVAAQDPDCAADVLLLSAPNPFGSKTQSRLLHENYHRGYTGPVAGGRFQRNLTEFGPLLDKIKTPIVLILPDDTEWDPDPGARGELALKHFTQVNVPHLIIAKPPGFYGHLGAYLPMFDYRYGTCIQSFLENPKSGACRPSPIASDDFRSIISIRQVAGADKKALSSAGELAEKNFVVYSMVDVVAKYYRYVSPGRADDHGRQ